ncbi:DUF1579 domain-containing protein [Chitinophaga qingshengii]|uniref:DUF1579 domain-containing protein n=1 Tax=Chitinophaga qingshengii TaxID=1569794 RepID=A0ABR7TR34_9BACT|nr:DUF1579 domain-containing protein [Chitinophaga qingshengii]MBC9932927.1 DUF1579 domain-containing protein [Chitinophaga qingshengii]
MKTLYVLATAIGCLLTANIAAAQMDSAAHKAWMTYMTPGPEHQQMAQTEGDWTTDMTFWKGPGAQPEKATGSCTNKMIMGGRYQESRFTSNMMDMPFEGLGTTAYDNARKMYLNTWIDNMGTGMMMMEGKWDPVINGIVYHGKSWDPVTQKMMDLRQVIKFKDANNYNLEMYRMHNGKEFKEMEIAFKRK